jgi:hypothetical protein
MGKGECRGQVKRLFNYSLWASLGDRATSRADRGSHSSFPQERSAVSRHKFKVGQLVHYLRCGGAYGVATSACWAGPSCLIDF